MRFGSSFLTLGALVRGLSTFPSYEERLEPNTKFWITFTGQIITAIGHPFLITMSTKASLDMSITPSNSTQRLPGIRYLKHPTARILLLQLGSY